MHAAVASMEACRTATGSLSAMRAAIASMEACHTGGEGAMNDDKSLNALVVTIPKGARP